MACAWLEGGSARPGGCYSGGKRMREGVMTGAVSGVCFGMRARDTGGEGREEKRRNGMAALRSEWMRRGLDGQLVGEGVSRGQGDLDIAYLS